MPQLTATKHPLTPFCNLEAPKHTKYNDPTQFFNMRGNQSVHLYKSHNEFSSINPPHLPLFVSWSISSILPFFVSYRKTVSATLCPQIRHLLSPRVILVSYTSCSLSCPPHTFIHLIHLIPYWVNVSIRSLRITGSIKVHSRKIFKSLCFATLFSNVASDVNAVSHRKARSRVQHHVSDWP